MEICSPIMVSIIVPVYGVEAYIEKCLYSIEKQSYQNIECILVDDCTTDNSMIIVNNFIRNKSHRSNIYKIVTHEQNRGLSAARNTGVKYAIGDFIYFLDSDDYITSNCIEDMVNIAVKLDVEIVWGGIERVYSNGIHKYVSLKNDNCKCCRKEIINKYIKQELYTEATNKLIKLEYLKKNGIFFVEGMLHEDVIWTFQLLAHDFSGAILDKPTYAYIQREGSIMSCLTQKNYDAQIKNLKLIDETITLYNLRRDITYLKYFQYMIEYSIWMLFYRKSTIKERIYLYRKLREINVDYKENILKTKGHIGYNEIHFCFNNINIAYFLFELQNTIRRIIGRIRKS